MVGIKQAKLPRKKQNCLARSTWRGHFTTSRNRPLTSCTTRSLRIVRTSSLCETRKAASWLLAAQFFSATTVVSCMRISRPFARHEISAFMIPRCFAIASAPSSEFAPQLPMVMAAYSSASPLNPSPRGRVSFSLRTTAKESRAPGVCHTKKKMSPSPRLLKSLSASCTW